MRARLAGGPTAAFMAARQPLERDAPALEQPETARRDPAQSVVSRGISPARARTERAHRRDRA